MRGLAAAELTAIGLYLFLIAGMFAVTTTTLLAVGAYGRWGPEPIDPAKLCTLGHFAVFGAADCFFIVSLYKHGGMDAIVVIVGSLWPVAAVVVCGLVAFFAVSHPERMGEQSEPV